MKKSLVLIGTITLLVAVIGLTTVHGMGFELIMSDAPLHNAIRSVIIAGLLALAFTVRPRPRWLRVALGVVAVVIMSIALAQTVNYALQILDALIYLAAATVFMNEALESELLPAPSQRVRKLGAA